MENQFRNKPSNQPIPCRSCCPNCQYGPMDGATGIKNPNAVPKDGDITICLSCAQVLQYVRKDDLLDLRIFGPEQVNALDAENQQTILRAVNLIKTRKPLANRNRAW